MKGRRGRRKTGRMETREGVKTGEGGKRRMEGRRRRMCSKGGR